MPARQPQSLRSRLRALPQLQYVQSQYEVRTELLPAQVNTLYEAHVFDLLRDLDGIVQRLQRRGKIRPDALVQPLEWPHIDAVLDLHREFPCPAQVAYLRLMGTAPAGNYCRSRSAVLSIGGAVSGACLVQSDESPAMAFIYGDFMAHSCQQTQA